MGKEKKELINLAKHNKPHIMNKTVEINLNGDEYPLLIKGVGNKAIKLELYIYYEDILNNHDKKVLESILWDRINTVYPDAKSTVIGHKRIIY